MANNTKNLLDIFKIFAEGNSTDGGINKTQIRSVIREMDSDHLESLIVKMVADAKSELNLTLTCGYCEGSFRDVIQAYNKVHGYVSLLVSIPTTFFFQPLGSVDICHSLPRRVMECNNGASKCLPMYLTRSVPRVTLHLIFLSRPVYH